MPEHSRQIMTLVVSAAFTGIVATVWAVTFFPSASKALRESSMDQLASPFAEMPEMPAISDTFATEDEFTSSPEVTPDDTYGYESTGTSSENLVE